MARRNKNKKTVSQAPPLAGTAFGNPNSAQNTTKGPVRGKYLPEGMTEEEFEKQFTRQRPKIEYEQPESNLPQDDYANQTRHGSQGVDLRTDYQKRTGSKYLSYEAELAASKGTAAKVSPAAQPPAAQPPAAQPPAAQPAAGQPAAGQPAAVQPPAGQPITGQPQFTEEEKLWIERRKHADAKGLGSQFSQHGTEGTLSPGSNSDPHMGQMSRPAGLNAQPMGYTPPGGMNGPQGGPPASEPMGVPAANDPASLAMGMGPASSIANMNIPQMLAGGPPMENGTIVPPEQAQNQTMAEQLASHPAQTTADRHQRQTVQNWASEASTPITGLDSGMGPASSIANMNAPAMLAGGPPMDRVMGFGVADQPGPTGIDTRADEFLSRDTQAMSVELASLGKAMDDHVREQVALRLREIDADQSLTPDQKLEAAVQEAKIAHQRNRDAVATSALDLAFGEGSGREGISNLVEDITSGVVTFSEVYNNPNTAPAIRRELARLIADPNIRNVLIPPRGNVNAGFNGGGGNEGAATRGAWAEFSPQEKTELLRRQKEMYNSSGSDMPYSLWARYNGPDRILYSRWEAHNLSNEAMGFDTLDYQSWMQRNEKNSYRQWKNIREKPKREAASRKANAETRRKTRQRKDAISDMKSSNPIARANAYRHHPKFANMSRQERATDWYGNMPDEERMKVRLLLGHSYFAELPVVAEARDAEVEIQNVRRGVDGKGAMLGRDFAAAEQAAEDQYAELLFTVMQTPSAQAILASEDAAYKNFVPMFEQEVRDRQASAVLERETRKAENLRGGRTTDEQRKNERIGADMHKAKLLIDQVIDMGDGKSFVASANDVVTAYRYLTEGPINKDFPGDVAADGERNEELLQLVNTMRPMLFMSEADIRRQQAERVNAGIMASGETGSAEADSSAQQMPFKDHQKLLKSIMGSRTEMSRSSIMRKYLERLQARGIEPHSAILDQIEAVGSAK